MGRSSRLRLEQPECREPTCPLFGQPHPRCKAHSKLSSGGPCMSPAMDGQLVCYGHGGNQKSGKGKAQKLIAQHEIRTRVSKIVAYSELDRSTPEEGLFTEVRWSGQVAIALGEACEALIADAQLTTNGAG